MYLKKQSSYGSFREACLIWYFIRIAIGLINYDFQGENLTNDIGKTIQVINPISSG